MDHRVIERNMGLMLVLVIGVISLGGLAEIVPLFWQDAVTKPVPGLRPLTARRRGLAAGRRARRPGMPRVAAGRRRRHQRHSTLARRF